MFISTFCSKKVHAGLMIHHDFHFQMLIALESYYWRYCSASELVNMILAFIETR